MARKAAKIKQAELRQLYKNETRMNAVAQKNEIT